MVTNKYTNLLNKINNNKEPINNNKPIGSSLPISKPVEIKEQKRDKNKIADLDGSKIIITFPFSYENVNNVKQIIGRKYDAKTKTWNVKASLISFQALDKLGYTFTESAQRKYDNLLNNVGYFNLDKVKFDVNDIKVAKGLSLRNYQIETLKFIEGHKGKCILALDQGLGKSPIISTYINYHPEIKPIVIVCPASLKYNWLNEINKWSPKRKVEIIEGKKSNKIKKTTDVIIINYDLLDAWKKQISEIKPELMVVDESQFIKAIKGVKRVKAIKSISKSCKRIIGLSGTPIVNKSSDIWNIISIIKPDMFGSATEFLMRYGNPQYNGYGYVYNGVSNAEELNGILSNIMIRYKKSEVLTELPDKIYSYIPLEIDNRNEYNKAETNFIDYVRQTKGNKAAKKASYAESLVKIGYLRQIAAKGALHNAIELIKTKLEMTDEKIIVFGIHREILDELEKEFKDCCIKIDGSVSSSKRQELIDKFRDDKNIRLMIGNITACGTGLNLQFASISIFLQLPWTQAALSQAEDRIYRMGQQHKVNIIYALPMNTIEYRLSKLIESKADISSKIIDGVDYKDENSIMALMKEYEKEY